MRRALPDGETVWFFVNHAMDAFEADVTLDGAGVSGLDLFTGEEYAVAHAVGAGKTTFRLSLKRNQSAMIRATVGAAASPRPRFRLCGRWRLPPWESGRRAKTCCPWSGWIWTA
jgi:hypothetical protein